MHAGLLRQLEFPPEPRRRVDWLVRTHGERMCWGKCHPVQCVEADVPVVMGHVPLSAPEDNGHCVAIDTGAGTWGEAGCLTALILPERRFLSVSGL